MKNWIFGGNKHNVLMIGTQGVGKTSFLYFLQSLSPMNNIPTIGPCFGYWAEVTDYNSLSIMTYDVPYWKIPPSPYKPMPKQPFEAIIYMVDTTQCINLEEDAQELAKYLQLPLEPKLAALLPNSPIPLLVLLNKIDICPFRVIVKDYVDALRLVNYSIERTWKVVPVSALCGTHVVKAMRWLECLLSNTST